jgi:hypothetical protein
MKKPTINEILTLADRKGYPIYYSNGVYDYNLNVWGIRSADRDTVHFNDMCAIFYQSTRGIWSVDYFSITTDPSNLLLKNPINNNGTAILCEGHHPKLWSYGFHKSRRDHKALVQYSPCWVYRDNNKDDVIDKNLPKERGMFGINMHRASAWVNSPNIGLYSAGCQVHEDVDRYNKVFIPLIESCVREGNRTFSYTLCLEEWFNG